jgi:ferredoxin
MATIITDECINCGVCEPECPNTAIDDGSGEGLDFYYIDPELCTECVGFHGEEACQEVCPVDCCIPDEDIVETEEELLARANKLHPDDTFPELDALTNETSLFRNPDRKNANL